MNLVRLGLVVWTSYSVSIDHKSNINVDWYQKRIGNMLQLDLDSVEERSRAIEAKPPATWSIAMWLSLGLVVVVVILWWWWWWYGGSCGGVCRKVPTIQGNDESDTKEQKYIGKLMWMEITMTIPYDTMGEKEKVRVVCWERKRHVHTKLHHDKCAHC